MAYDVSALSTYVNEQNFPILRKSIFGSKTVELFDKQSGIKHSEALNYMDAEAIFQNNAAGQPIESLGNTKFTQRYITVSPIAVRQDYDPRDLNTKYLQSQMKAGSADDEIPFEADVVDALTEKVANQVEIAVWRGDTTLTGASNVNLNKFDGFIKKLDADAEVIKVTGATLTSANVVAQLDKVYETIPTDILDSSELGIYIGRDLYRTYTQALKNANLFHYSVDGGDSFTMPGTTVKVHALPGLNGTGRVYAGEAKNFVTGHDLLGEDDNAKAEYLFDTEKVKVRIAFKLGVQVKFPSQIVTYKAN